MVFDELLIVDDNNKDNLIAYWCQKRIALNQNVLGLIQGGTGTGKTYAACSLAQAIDKNFTINNVVFNAEEFTDRLNNGNLKPGSCIVFDEAGVGISASEWYTKQVIAFHQIMQTFRNMNLIVIFTVPDYTFIESKSRKLIHILFTTDKIDYEKQLCKIRVELVKIRYDIRQGNKNVYTQYFRIKRRGFPPAACPAWWIEMPSPSLVAEYELKKNRYTKDLNIKQGNIIRELGNSPGSGNHIFTDRQKEMIELNKQGKTTAEIAKIMGVTARSISVMKRTIQYKDPTIKFKIITNNYLQRLKAQRDNADNSRRVIENNRQTPENSEVS